MDMSKGCQFTKHNGSTKSQFSIWFRDSEIALSFWMEHKIFVQQNWNDPNTKFQVTFPENNYDGYGNSSDIMNKNIL